MPEFLTPTPGTLLLVGMSIAAFMPGDEAKRGLELAKQAAQAKAARQAKTGGSMLGGRKHAGLILVVIALVLMAIYVLPRFL